MLLSAVFAGSVISGLAACGGDSEEAYTATVTVNGDNAPLADVWLDLWSVVIITVEAGEGVDPAEVGTQYPDNTKLATAKTDANGVAKFVLTSKPKEFEEVKNGETVKKPNPDFKAYEFNPVEGATYYVKQAEHGETAFDRAYPYNYMLHMEKDQYGLNVSNFDFDANKSAKLTYDYVPNHFRYAQRFAHPYYREYDWKDKEVPEVKESEDKTLQVPVKAGNVTYVDFSPFKNPGTVSAADINPVTGRPYGDAEASAKGIEIVNYATLAASGKYRISISTATASATPVLRYFIATEGYASLDEDGVPNNIDLITGTGADEKYTGTNYMDFDLDTTKSNATYHFYVTSNIDCTATVTVERTGDATERGETESIPVYAQNLYDSKKFPVGEELTAVPVDGSATAVLGDDGFYHLNGADGRIIAVMLGNNTLVEERVGVEPISNWSNYLYVNEGENRVYDYSPLIDAYVNSNYGVINDDGVYGLNQDLYDFLHKFADRFMNTNESDPAAVAGSETKWLLACVYYAQDPVYPELTVGDNAVEFEGNSDFNAYMTFTPAADGWFKFEDTDFEIAEILVNGKNVYSDGSSTPFKVVANTKYTVEILFGYDAAVNSYSLTLSETEEPKFNVGENEISFGGENVVSMNFTGTDGTYTIQLGGSHDVMYLQNNVTITIGEGAGATVVTLTPNSTPRFAATGVQLSAGVKITVSCPDYMGFAPTVSGTLTITAE